VILLLLSCAPTSEDTAPPASGPVHLNDARQLHFTPKLDAATLTRLSHADITLDWSTLHQGDRGGALIAGDITTVRLRQFTALSPSALLEGFSAGTITQADVSMTLRCQPTAEACAFSDFTFEAGHSFDVAGAFSEDGGTWMAEVFVDPDQPAEARILLIADDSSPLTVADITNDSSAIQLTVDEKPGEIALPEGGTLDWGDLTQTGDGRVLLPDRVETALLVTTDASTALESLILDPWQLAEVVALDVYGETTLSLDAPWSAGSSHWLILQGRGSEQHLTLSLFPLESP
jgi:hypothetical protein